LYDFSWDEFCSFYVEMVKNRLQDAVQRSQAQRVLVYTLDTLLRLLHPMIPFLTEEVWQLLSEIAPERGLEKPEPAAASVMIAPWPTCDAKRQDTEIEVRFARFQEVLRVNRDVRMRQNVPHKTTLEFSVRCDRETATMLEPMKPYFHALSANTAEVIGPDAVQYPISANTSLSGMEVSVNLEGIIDVEAEMTRKRRELEKITGLIMAKEKKLQNKNFVERAPAEVVQKEQESLQQLKDQQMHDEIVLKEYCNFSIERRKTNDP